MLEEYVDCIILLRQLERHHLWNTCLSILARFGFNSPTPRANSISLTSEIVVNPIIKGGENMSSLRPLVQQKPFILRWQIALKCAESLHFFNYFSNIRILASLERHSLQDFENYPSFVPCILHVGLINNSWG